MDEQKCVKCINEHRIMELENDIKRNQETHKEFFSRFEKVNERVVGYEKSMSYLTSTVSDISKDVKEIKEKPTKRWESLVMCVLTGIVSLIIGFMLKGVFPM